MYGRNIKRYGMRKIVPPDSHHAFDDIVKEEKSKQSVSPFASSDSSHNSNFSASAGLSDSSFKGPLTRKKTLEISKSMSRNESSHSTSQHMTSNSSALFICPHDDSNSIITYSPAVQKKKRGTALKDVNVKCVAKTKAKKTTGAGKKQKPESKKKNLKTQGKENTTPKIPENVPDFEAFDNYELTVQAETPHVCSTPKHTVADSPCNVSHISGDGNHPLSCSYDDEPDVNVAQESHNITYRKSKRNTVNHLRKCRKEKLEGSTKADNLESSDSGNLSVDSNTYSSLYQTGGDSHYFSLKKSSDSDSDNTSGEEDWCSSADISTESLLTSFHEMRILSDSIHDKLEMEDRNSNVSKRLTRSCAIEEVEHEEQSTYDSSQSLFDDSEINSGPGPGPSLSQIAEDEEDEEDSDEEEEDGDEGEEDSDEEEEDSGEEEEDSGEEEGEEEVEEDYQDEESDKVDLEATQNISSPNSSPSSGGKSDVTLFQLAESMSFYEKLSNSSICDIEISAEERVLSLCDQKEPIPFSACISPRMMSKCVKIGEGVYGEVFRSVSDGNSVALKIIPIQGDFDVNDCPQKNFDEILPEIVIAKELSDLTKGKSNQTGNFCQVKSVSCVKGKFPSQLLDQWDEYSKRKRSENDRPDIFPDDQLFIVFEFFDGGCALENYKFTNHQEAYSVLRQVVFALAVAEEELEFEHRDLHIGNVLVRPCTEEFVTFKVLDTVYQFPSEGVFATVIDFTISRLKKDDCAVFFDVATDEGLFEGSGDFQFDVYRDMRIENGNDWQKFCPHSNVLWVNYLCKKLTTTTKYKESGRGCRDVQRHLRCLVDSMLDYDSCMFLIEDSSLWNVE